jgi:enolase
LEIQEFMVVPEGKSVSEKIMAGAAIYQRLRELLKKTYGPGAISVGDEGGFAPSISDPKEALEIVAASIKKAGFKAKIALDCASTQFYRKGSYYLQGIPFNKEKLVSFYQELLENYPIVSLEDPFAEDDWEGWHLLKNKIKEDILLIGDDLTVTNTERIKKAKDFCSGLLLKPNQVGTVSEAMESFDLAKSYNWKIMVSHRSGETCDDFIADLAVGSGAELIKSGAPARGERVAKYNRLLEIDNL